MSQSYNNVEEFKDWWLVTTNRIRPPFTDPIFCTDVSCSLCLFRAGQYQVELYVAKPNTITPEHSHPGVESITMYLTGNLIFPSDSSHDLSKLQYANSVTGAHILLGKCGAVLHAGEEHSALTGEEGGAFLVFEHWDKNITPTSVTLQWSGDSVGTQHSELLEKKGV